MNWNEEKRDTLYTCWYTMGAMAPLSSILHGLFGLVENRICFDRNNGSDRKKEIDWHHSFVIFSCHVGGIGS